MFIFVKRNISNENGQIIIEVKLSHEHFIAIVNLLMITIETNCDHGFLLFRNISK